MNTICPRCCTLLETSYIMFGATVECPACRASMVPERAAGTAVSNTGYAITFRDFCRLLTDQEYRPVILPHLRDWFGYEVPLTRDGFFIVAPDGSSVPPLTVHLNIQSSARQRYDLYQTAMSLWR